MAEVRMATLEDFACKPYTFELESPFGEVLMVQMRALNPDEVIQLNYNNPKPPPPVADIRKEGGQFFNLYNYEDSGYRKALEEWTASARRRLVATALTSPVLPGESIEEKVEALNGIAAWAIVGLHQAVNMLLGVGGDAVRLRQFQPDGAADT